MDKTIEQEKLEVFGPGILEANIDCTIPPVFIDPTYYGDFGKLQREIDEKREIVYKPKDW